MKPVLYYIHDPMCSWCWGFRPVWNEVQQSLSGRFDIRYILGGLAPDSDEAMPLPMQHAISDTWKRIQQEIPDTAFNFDFWTLSQPRRSTYPACRAIIACRNQQPQLASTMLLSIQQAYYLQAKNPSDLNVLLELSEKLGLDVKRFANDIQSDLCQNALLKEIEFCRSIGVNSFPSLILKHGKSYTSIDIDYNNSKNILDQVL